MFLVCLFFLGVLSVLRRLLVVFVFFYLFRFRRGRRLRVGRVGLDLDFFEYLVSNIELGVFFFRGYYFYGVGGFVFF